MFGLKKEACIVAENKRTIKLPTFYNTAVMRPGDHVQFLETRKFCDTWQVWVDPYHVFFQQNEQISEVVAVRLADACSVMLNNILCHHFTVFFLFERVAMTIF